MGVAHTEDCSANGPVPYTAAGAAAQARGHSTVSLVSPISSDGTAAVLCRRPSGISMRSAVGMAAPAGALPNSRPAPAIHPIPGTRPPTSEQQRPVAQLQQPGPRAADGQVPYGCEERDGAAPRPPARARDSAVVRPATIVAALLLL